MLSEKVPRPIVAPAVGFGYCFAQGFVGVVEPCGAGVVEVGEGAFLEFLGRCVVFGQDAVRVARDHLWHSVDKVGRVEPVFAEFVEPFSGGCDFDGAYPVRPIYGRTGCNVANRPLYIQQCGPRSAAVSHTQINQHLPRGPKIPIMTNHTEPIRD